MLCCTWGRGVRIWGSAGGRWRFLGRFCSPPRPPCLARSWSWGARSAGKSPGRPGGALGVQNSFPLDANVPRDVLLFQHERPGFFRLLGLFCASQLVFWTYLAYVAFHSLRATGADRPESDSPQEAGRLLPTLPGGATLKPGSNKWRYGFAASSLTVGFCSKCTKTGCLIVVGGFVFSRRSVSRVLLHRGGQEVSLTTYYLFGLSSSFTVPLRQISCVSHRSEIRAMIPLKVKGRPFYFLLDKQGRITNAKLFDITVGAYRKL